MYCDFTFHPFFLPQSQIISIGNWMSGAKNWTYMYEHPNINENVGKNYCRKLNVRYHKPYTCVRRLQIYII